MTKILIVRKMSSLEFYYKGSHPNPELKAGHDEQNGNLAKVEKILKNAKLDYKIITRDELSKELVAQYDFVFSVGGDGTVIATAAFNESTPQLNIKNDKRSAGVLCAPDLEKAVKSIITGKYKIEEWTRQDVFLDEKFVGRALNEVCVGEQMKFFKMDKYHLEFIGKYGKKYSDIQQNSGLVMVTGTGSTGWPSVFKPFPRNSNFFRFNAVLPHEQKINEGEGLSFKVVYLKHEGKFAIDTIEYNFPRDAVLEVKLSNKPLRVVVPL